MQEFVDLRVNRHCCLHTILLANLFREVEAEAAAWASTMGSSKIANIEWKRKSVSMEMDFFTS